MSTIEVYSPFDEHLIRTVPRFDADEAERALTLAYQTYQNRDQWLKTYERVEILQRTQALLEQRQDQLALAANGVTVRSITFRFPIPILILEKNRTPSTF